MHQLGALAPLCWNLGPTIAPLDAFQRAGSQGRNTSFLHSKAHILDALEIQAPALVNMRTEVFWHRGCSVLDVGAGSGEVGYYLHRKSGIVVKALDVHKPESSKYWRSVAGTHSASFLPIQLFSGSSLPMLNASFDLVMFNSVLHHAATKAAALIREAARVARRFIVVLEDLHIPGHRAIEHRNLVHDPQGIFRTLSEWYLMFRSAPGVRDVHHEMLCQHLNDTQLPCFSFGVSHRIFYALFVIEL